MNPRVRNGLLIFLAVVVAFGIGAAWQFTSARTAREQLNTVTAERDATRAELEMQRLEATLAAAALAAQLGNYERGRQLASDFFTGLDTHQAAAPEAATAAINEIKAERDAVITLLSRSEPGSGLQLTRMLVRYRQALGHDAQGIAPAMLDSAGR